MAIPFLLRGWHARPGKETVTGQLLAQQPASPSGTGRVEPVDSTLPPAPRPNADPRQLDKPILSGQSALVVTEAEARRIAESVLDLDAVVITGSREFDVGWVYTWDSRRHQQTGDFRDATGGNAPILVDRADGVAHFTGTARPIEEYIARYKARDAHDERSWHP